MKRFSRFMAAGFVLLSLAACAQEDGWQPTVDSAYDPRPSALNGYLADCRRLASQASDQDQSVGEDTGLGALGGAALGAILGAITGGPLTGAAIGAVTGGGVGLGTSASSSSDAFKQAYVNCMRQRGHAVVN